MCRILFALLVRQLEFLGEGRIIVIAGQMRDRRQWALLGEVECVRSTISADVDDGGREQSRSRTGSIVESQVSM